MIFPLVLLFVQAASAADPGAAISGCRGHRFEAKVVATVDGKPARKTIKLCGAEGQSTSAWVGTLKDAVKTVQSNAKMPAEMREQIVAALEVEIAKLGVPEAPASTVFSLPAPAAPPAARAPEYSALPPLPAPVAKPDVRLPEYAQLPPLPSPAATPRPVAQVAAPLLARPRLRIQCTNPGLGGPAPCTELDRETVLTVRADEALPGGTSLRFLRKGEIRADVALAQLRKGQSVRLGLPRQLCAGAVGSQVEFQVVRKASAAASGQVVGSEGPYLLRC